MGTYGDLTKYILGITAEIWEGRDLTSLRRHYAEDVLMRFPSGLLRGNQVVIDGTMATLAEFPDRQLLGDDVIWSGSEAAGYLSSHRIVTNGTHTGHGEFGPPTGRGFEIYVIADCHAKDEVIDDEWLIRDLGGVARQLGLDPMEHARERIAREGGHNAARAPFHPRDDVPGPYRGTGNDDEWGARLEDVLTRIMDKDIAVIRRAYDRAARVAHWGARGGWSWGWAEADWMRLRAAFPSAAFAVHHRIGRADAGRPPRAAVRWSLTGRHDGAGHFGASTGAEVHVMGITHAEWGPHGLRREWTLIDEVSIWKQILMATGAHD